MTSPEEIRRTAAEWVIRSDAPGFPDRAAFEAWRDSDPRHAAAFGRARQLWDALEAGGAAAQAAPAPANDVAGGTGHRVRRRMVVGAMAAGLVATIGIGASTDLLTVLRADLQTAHGGHLSRTLADGSRIELDDDSAVTLHFSAGERRVRLLKGQMFVDAAPVGAGERRPFVVEVANGETRALGTSFNVNRLGDRVDVTAVTHRIAVRTTGKAAPAGALALSPGQALRYDAAGAMVPRAAAPALATAWRKGRIVLDRATLQDACAMLGRYSRRPVRLWTRAGDTRRISGVFDARDVEGSLRLIAREHGLRVVRVPLLGFVLV